MDFYLPTMIGFVVGAAAGAAFEGARTEYQPVSDRYGYLFTKTEDEALDLLAHGLAFVYSAEPLPERKGQTQDISFNKDDLLVSTVTKEIKYWRDQKKVREFKGIHGYQYPNEFMVTIELNDERMTPIRDNIMLARYLARVDQEIKGFNFDRIDQN